MTGSLLLAAGIDLNNIVNFINSYLSNILVVLLLGGGIWFTLLLRGIQFRGFTTGMGMTFGGLFSKKGEAGADGMSSFQALATAVAAQVGTGNIAGIATALTMGGPGAILWMWIAACFGMATIFAEAMMAQKFKIVNAAGETTGGPVYYIKQAFKGGLGQFLAGLFAVLIVFALGFMGNAVQSNSIAASFVQAFSTEAFKIQPWWVGLAVACISLYVFLGGTKRIVQITEVLVPFMAATYIIGALIILLVNFKNIPTGFHDVFVGAFNPRAVFGGGFGATVQLALMKGVSRGLFANEAGMGSTPHAHAVAKVNHPAEQGFVAMAGVFICSFCIVTLTALVIICTRTADGQSVIASGLTGAELSQMAYSTLYGKAGYVFIAICMFFFAFSTIVGWFYFGRANISYLFGQKAILPYSILVAICIFLGSLAEVKLVWNMADMFNSMMVVPNILALFALSMLIKKIHDDYYNNFKKNK